MRAAGIPNKNKRGLKAELKKAYGKDFDVVMMMARNCLTLHDIALQHSEGLVTSGESEQGNGQIIDASSSAKLANEALDKLAQYVEPKLKAIEVSGAVATMTHEQWLDSIDELDDEEV